MEEKNIVKEYKSGPLTVIWQPKKCIHSAICANGLPEVFDPNKRPWIDPDNAGTKEIMKQIDQCPSGALSYKLEKTDENSDDMDNSKEEQIKIDAFNCGPLRVPGPITLIYKGEERTITDKNITFCRCGASSNKPFCDGTHKKIGFQD